VGAQEAIDGSYANSGIHLVYETSKKYPAVALHQLSDVLELSGGAYEMKDQTLHILFPYPTLDNSAVDPNLSPVQWAFEDQSLDTITALKKLVREKPRSPLVLFHLTRSVGTFEQLLQNSGFAFALIRGQITPPRSWSSILTVHKNQNLIEQRSMYKPQVIVTDTMSEEELNQLREDDANLWILLTDPLRVNKALFETPRLLVFNPILLENEKFVSHFDALLQGTKTLTVSTGLPVKRAVVYFEKNVTHSLLRWQVAEAAVASEDYLSRCFVRELNLSPFEYFIAIRMYKARSLLRRGNLSVGEVAGECGYKDPAYFSRVFRTYFKVLPKNII
jgi:AraC-like DNA-binding protein